MPNDETAVFIYLRCFLPFSRRALTNCALKKKDVNVLLLIRSTYGTYIDPSDFDYDQDTIPSFSEATVHIIF